MSTQIATQPVASPETSKREEEENQEENSSKQKLEGEALIAALKKQLEYYFSKENLMNDRYLQSKMNAELYVPIEVIAGFKMVQNLTTDYDMVVSAIKELSSLSVDETGKMVKPNIKAHRNVVILREIPTATPPEEVRSIFDEERLSKITEIKPDINDFWYITFADDDSAITTLEYLRDKKFKDQPVKARLKTENPLRVLLASVAAANTQPIQQQQSYTYPQQNWVEVQAYQYNGYGQWENAEGYKGAYDNRRSGYRKPGRNYNNRGGRGGYKNHGNREVQNANNANANNPARKRRESGGNAHVLQFTNSQHFPPLPSQNYKSGYTTDYKKYSKQEIIDVCLSSTPANPSIVSIDSKIVLSEPNLQLEVTKPWPKKLDQPVDAEKVEKVEETEKSNSSSTNGTAQPTVTTSNTSTENADQKSS